MQWLSYHLQIRSGNAFSERTFETTLYVFILITSMYTRNLQVGFSAKLLGILLWDIELSRSGLPASKGSVWRCNRRIRYTIRRKLQGLYVDYAIVERQFNFMDIRYARRRYDFLFIKISIVSRFHFVCCRWKETNSHVLTYYSYAMFKTVLISVQVSPIIRLFIHVLAGRRWTFGLIDIQKIIVGSNRVPYKNRYDEQLLSHETSYYFLLKKWIFTDRCCARLFSVYSTQLISSENFLWKETYYLVHSVFSVVNKITMRLIYEGWYGRGTVPFVIENYFHANSNEMITYAPP